ncbi:SPFH domain-containing protein [Thermoactinomyces sp. CICC 10523]|jgi:regulator of protease activity HflC (stomatin/prohibitin superfamily)|uniref:SPFH domain-containing protein n=1 Tax=Thermoactinomyces sp. CICC 10523 TaxID=2767428 RepID=UPI0018DC3D3A|nr:SPFH domain-containing protein [Thermoactinomyces sp. CICC 10523]MBH8597158.1 SPFH domain-containing protein [Thermoactinomyces sp. CICC 10523]
MTRTEERVAWKANGFLFLLLEIFLLLAGAGLVIYGIGIIFLVVAVLLLPGFVMIQPNEARVLTFFGKYAGTIAEDGFFWANPFASKKKISLRVRNFHSDKLKVNDADGNPILIGAVIVWKVIDSAKALFDVEDFNVFVAIQSETAIRSLASRYPYDRHDQSLPSLMGAPEEVAENLCTELQERLKIAGVEILEARISHLAYAPEIAQAMLRRQQAQAVIAARQKIVEGAIGMVEMALDHIEKKGVVELDEERKAAMVNNLMVALVSEGETTPVINTGTLFT